MEPGFNVSSTENTTQAKVCKVFTKSVQIYILKNDAWSSAIHGQFVMRTEQTSSPDIRFEVYRQNEPKLSFMVLLKSDKGMKAKGPKDWVLTVLKISDIGAFVDYTEELEEQVIAIRFSDSAVAGEFAGHIESLVAKLTRRISINPAEKFRKQSQQQWECRMCVHSNLGGLKCVRCGTHREVPAEPEKPVLTEEQNLVVAMIMSMELGFPFEKVQTAVSVTLTQAEAIDFLLENRPSFHSHHSSKNRKRYNSTKEDFERAAFIIGSGPKVSGKVFRLLRTVTKKLLEPDLKYRTLDTSREKVESLIGYHGVLEFLSLLGFRGDDTETRLYIDAGQPSTAIIDTALQVLEQKILEFDRPANLDCPESFTLTQLVAFMTHEQLRDEKTHKVITLMHKNFTTSSDLLAALRGRFFLHHYQKEAEAAIPVRCTKVGIVLKHWIKTFWQEDFVNEEDLKVQLREFIADMKREAHKTSQVLGSDVQKLIKLQGEEEEVQAGGFNVSADEGPPRPFVDLNTLSPEVLADQLTLLDQEFFFKIKPRECINQSWRSNPKTAANVLRMIKHFNQVCGWLQVEILLCPDIHKRANFMRRVIRLGQRFMMNQDYSCLYAVYTSLNSACIFRLKHCWAKLPTAERKLFEQFKELFAQKPGNFKNLRFCLRNAAPPAIPHIGIFLKDLVFIEDGNDSKVDKEKFLSSTINLTKYNRLFERIQFLQSFQRKPYTIQSDPEIRRAVLARFEEHERMNLSDDHMWKISTEAKERDKAAAEKKTWLFG